MATAAGRVATATLSDQAKLLKATSRAVHSAIVTPALVVSHLVGST
jgi:hypothetical protein